MPKQIVEILAWLGQFGIALAASTGLAYLLFKFFAERWIESKFATRLEQLRGEQAQQLAQLNYRINTALKRVNQIQEREFQVLSELWGKLNEAYRFVHSITSAMQSHPDIDAMDEPRFEHWLTKSDLDDPHRNQLRDAGRTKRSKLYQEFIVWYQIRDAQYACNDFRKCLDYNSIFVRPEIKKVFTEIDELLYGAVISRTVSVHASDHRGWLEAAETVQEKVNP